ncbi:GNAT family N-acetyltransferase [Spiroplasma diminutum]|uniref:N-acetyltransferase domain-containing protein n=1 Tax=Spiroplasma diminutum CUAS-1 TaxID=1276221 RepID=S5M1P0_9MOLU|nr:GNAT family N-acetyltransferase [Spiroplasma diminutum]AGR41982.1 hypothetical protein SDIMI_v3c02780 [Spiroplasma diminutum CUAS-1]
MELKYKSKISDIKKYDIIAKVYLSYYVDPIYNEITQNQTENHEVLTFKNHPSSIIKSNWNYEFENLDEVKEFKPKFLTNFTTKEYKNMELTNGIEFKTNYKFMALDLNEKDRYENIEIDKAQFLRVETKDQLDSFVKNVATIFSEEVTDSKKFYGLFEQYQKISDLFIIKYEDEYVGTGHLIHFDDKSTVIDDITMLESVRGKGLATFLMKSLINRCLEKGQKEVYLFGSEMAFNIYKKLGFIEEDFWLEQYKINY